MAANAYVKESFCIYANDGQPRSHIEDGEGPTGWYQWEDTARLTYTHRKWSSFGSQELDNLKGARYTETF